MNFVHDIFFEKGNYKLKVFQIFFTMVLWIIFLIPIITTFHSVLVQDSSNGLLKWNYREAFSLFNTLENYYLSLFPLLFILSLLLTFRNNYLIENYYKKEYTYNREKMLKRKNIIANTYQLRFGDNEFRENIKYYQVVPNKNFEADELHKLFKENSVEV